jgi:lysyl-tRNA synthetase class 2
MAVRIMSMRFAGNALRFYVCKGEGVLVQIVCDGRYFSKNDSDNVTFVEHHKLFQRGDW